MIGLLAFTSKPQRAQGHESQLQKTHTHMHTQVLIRHCSVVKDVITTPQFYIPNRSLFLNRDGVGPMQVIFTVTIQREKRALLH